MGLEVGETVGAVGEADVGPNEGEAAHAHHSTSLVNGSREKGADVMDRQGLASLKKGRIFMRYLHFNRPYSPVGLDVVGDLVGEPAIATTRIGGRQGNV